MASSKPKSKILNRISKESQETEEWYNELLKEVKRNNKTNTKVIMNKVVVRGKDKQKEPDLTNLRIIYNQYFNFAILI